MCSDVVSSTVGFARQVHRKTLGIGERLRGDGTSRDRGLNHAGVRVDR